MAGERKAFLLRLNEDLYEEIRRWADAELRSVNGQIEFILRRAARERRGERTVPPPAGPGAPAAGEPGVDPAPPRR